MLIYWLVEDLMQGGCIWYLKKCDKSQRYKSLWATFKLLIYNIIKEKLDLQEALTVKTISVQEIMVIYLF